MSAVVERDKEPEEREKRVLRILCALRCNALVASNVKEASAAVSACESPACPCMCMCADGLLPPVYACAMKRK